MVLTYFSISSKYCDLCKKSYIYTDHWWTKHICFHIQVAENLNSKIVSPNRNFWIFPKPQCSCTCNVWVNFKPKKVDGTQGKIIVAKSIPSLLPQHCVDRVPSKLVRLKGLMCCLFLKWILIPHYCGMKNSWETALFWESHVLLHISE